MAARHGHDVHDARLLATLFQLARVGLVDSGAGEDVLSQQAEGDARHEHTALVVQAGGDGEEACTECFDAMPPCITASCMVAVCAVRMTRAVSQAARCAVPCTV